MRIWQFAARILMVLASLNLAAAPSFSATQNVQQSIGDFGAAHGLPEGSLPKILAHAVAGGLASELSGGSFADGALAAGLSEIASSAVGESGLSPAQQVNLQRLIATAAVLIANGGDADSAGTAATIAGSAHQNNYLNHDEAFAREQEREQCAQGDQGACERAAEWDALDNQRDTQLRTVCVQDIHGSACQAAMRDLTEAALSYHTQPPSQYETPRDYLAELSHATTQPI